MEYLDIEQRSSWPIEPELTGFVTEQMQANAEMEALPVPKPGTVDIVKMRNFRRFNADGSSKLPIVEQAYDENIKLADREIALRIFPVEEAKGIHVHFHGGGWVMGSIYEQDLLLWKLARETQLTVISIDYPLAPEHRLESIIAIAQQTLLAIALKYPGVSLTIGGESAGAHVALNAAFGLSQCPEQFARVQALALSFGLYDLSMTPSQRQWGSRMLGLSTDYLEWFYQLAMPNLSAEERRAPELSPLYRDDLSNMPAALFLVGEYDPLIDDSLFMAARWRAAGNATQLKVYPKAPHGFIGQPTAMANAANRVTHAFLNQQIDSTGD